jgi:hypothetical protein
MAHTCDSIGTDASNGIHIVKAIRIPHKFVHQPESHELTEFIENEMIGPGDENCGHSQYCFSARAKTVRYFYSFSIALGLFHGKRLLHTNQFSYVIKIHSLNGTFH